MKKTVLLVLGVLLFISFTSCSLKDEDTLRVGMDLKYYPFTGMDQEGKPSGIEVDIAMALGDFLEEKVEIVNTDFSMLIPALQSGEIDIVIGSMSITEERQKVVDFSDPYLYDRIVALVNKDFAWKHVISDEMPVQQFLGLKDARYIGLAGSIAVSIPQAYGFEVASVTTEAVAEREISVGEADVLVGAYNLFGMHDTNRDTTIIYKNPIEFASTGMAIKKGNEELLGKVNQFIAQMEESGLNDRLRKDWDDAIKKKLFDDTLTLDYYLGLE
jgi:polar amino acid transport system substrate-binding protein